jgi:signal transduction histidine kinase
MGIYQDLSEKLEFEEKMDTIRQKLEESEKLASIGKLVAGVAHEMNNPLTGINMFANLALDDIPNDNPAVEKINIVLSQADKCRKIISDLLDFSIKGTGAGVMGEMDFNETINSVLSILKHHAKFKDITIKKDLDSDLYRIEGNHDQLQQMLINLMLKICKKV